MASVEALASIQTTGKIIDLITPDATHASAYACKTFSVVYTVPGGGGPGTDTIPALTPISVLSAGGLNGRSTFDPTLTNWLIVTACGTAKLYAVPIEETATLTTLIGTAFYAILQWVERGVVRPWQPEFGSIGSGLPLPYVDGALLYIDPTTHQPIWLAGVQGSVLRFNNGIWELIPPGNPNDLLFMAPGLIPTWGPLTAAQLPLGVQINALPFGFWTDTQWKALNLWNGSTNVLPGPDSKGHVWTDIDYNDGFWPNAVETGVQHRPSTSIWSPNPHGATGQQSLFRAQFNLPATPPLSSANIVSVGGLEGTQGYFNGSPFNIGGSSIDISAFRSGANNVFAVLNSATTPFPPYWWFQLALS